MTIFFLRHSTLSVSRRPIAGEENNTVSHGNADDARDPGVTATAITVLQTMASATAAGQHQRQTGLSSSAKRFTTELDHTVEED